MSNKLDPATLRARYEEGVKAHKGGQAQQEGEVVALSMALGAFGETVNGSSLMKRASHAAKLFCIACAFIIPNLLMIVVALN